MVRVHGFATETRVFDTEVARGSSGGGWGGNTPPLKKVLNTPTEGRRIPYVLKGSAMSIGVSLGSLQHLGSPFYIFGHQGSILGFKRGTQITDPKTFENRI